MTSPSRYWREAATLIFAARCCMPSSEGNYTETQRLPTHQDHEKAKDHNYTVLMLKRSEENKFMPGAYVFPGGVSAESDFSGEWDGLFRKVAFKTIGDVARELSVNGPRPSMMSVNRTIDLSPDIAFRITAIRETFEETGIPLLVRNKELRLQQRRWKDSKHPLVSSTAISLADPDIACPSLELWRKRVQDDPGQFMEMCKELNAVPNVWGLIEWSNWLTPAMKAVDRPPDRPRRFDTMFYLCCADGVIQSKHDEYEVTHSVWISPSDVCNAGLYVRGPQRYELNRMAHYSDIESLVRYSKTRERRGLERWFTVLVKCSDGIIGLMRGNIEFEAHCPKITHFTSGFSPPPAGYARRHNVREPANDCTTTTAACGYVAPDSRNLIIAIPGFIQHNTHARPFCDLAGVFVPADVMCMRPG